MAPAIYRYEDLSNVNPIPKAEANRPNTLLTPASSPHMPYMQGGTTMKKE